MAEIPCICELLFLRRRFKYTLFYSKKGANIPVAFISFRVFDIQKRATKCWPGAYGKQSFCKIMPLKIQKKVLPQDGAPSIKNINILSLIHKPMQ